MDHNANDTPVDKAAALVTSAAPKHSRRLERSNPVINSQKQLSAIIPIALERNAAPEFGLPDMRGKKFGRLTVVAYGGRPMGHTYWIVRCSCGNYEVRRHRSVLKADPGSMCMECKHDIMDREKHFYRNESAITVVSALLEDSTAG